MKKTLFLILIALVAIGCSTLYIDDCIMRKHKKKSDDIVILIHGMGRTRFSMIMLDRHLKRHGYSTLSYSYPSTRSSIKVLSADFADFILKTSEKNPKKSIHIVSHSLGGILTREALVSLVNGDESNLRNGEFRKTPPKGGTPNARRKIELKKGSNITNNPYPSGATGLRSRTITKSGNYQIKIGRIVMLAPPNKGSKAASFFSKIWPVPQLLKPLKELRNAKNSPIHDVPVPKNIDIGIIAGRFDRKVTPEESHIDCEKDHITVNSAHTFIMNNKNVQKAVTNFLKSGSFTTKK